MKLNLPDDISSREDLRSLIIEIRNYARWYGQAMVKSRYNKDYGTPAAVSLPAAELIKQWHAKQEVSRQSLDELIATLEDYATMAPRITITLAAIPPATLKKTLISWCRKNIQPDILVDFRFNSTMLGGMVVAYGSHVHDWSFKKQIMSSLNKFPEVLRRV